MSRPSLLLLGAAACAEPAISMRLELPPPAQLEGFQLGCLTSFEVAVRGDTRPDDKGGCIQLREGIASIAELREQVSGEFDIDLPRSLLRGVEIRASSGRCSTEAAGGDTILYGIGAYTDGDDIAIRVAPNQSCNARSTASVRPIDFLGLARDAPCGELGVAGGSATGGTIRTSLLERAIFDDNVDRADLAGGTASLQLYTGNAGASCVALRYGSDGSPLTTQSCVRRGRGVCSTGAEIELPVIDGDIAFRSLDQALFDPARDGAVFGAIWGAGVLDPVALDGATIRPVDPASTAKIVYADLPAGAELVQSLPARTTTNGSGLFIAYVTEPTDFIVSHVDYPDQIVRLASPVNPSAAIIVLED